MVPLEEYEISREYSVFDPATYVTIATIAAIIVAKWWNC